jgi:predicted unusual protein kinase regulating ubiquinone biosynthesis (AarF/ABC1/UbiB family)
MPKDLSRRTDRTGWRETPVPKGAAPASSRPPGESVEQRPRHWVFSDIGPYVATYGVPAAALIVAVGYAHRRKKRRVTTAATQAATGVQGNRTQRNVEMARLGARVGATYAETAARKAFASADRREELDHEREMKTAADMAESLGQMKGALMKIAQMAGYVHDGLPEPMRQALSQLQSQAPPMAPELAARVIEEELGAPPEKIFVEWDPKPIAAASIGQVHRALWRNPATGREQAVAVKVQYPGVDLAIAADLDNTELIGNLFKMMFRGLDPKPLVAEIRARIGEELDYRIEAANQRAFASEYEGHPYASVPHVIDELSTQRVLTTELASGVPFNELLTWDQHEKDLAAETIFRFVFRSLYSFNHFNGDPHPGNYLFSPGGKVTFLDFGLVKQFTPDEIATFTKMIDLAVLKGDWQSYRQYLEEIGLLRPNAPITTEEATGFFRHFYEFVINDAVITWSPAYASSVVSTLFDRDGPIAQYATVPSAFVLIQRINMGLYAIFGQLGATGNYRRISEEIWPMTQGAPSTPMGEAEAAWKRDK